MTKRTKIIIIIVALVLIGAAATGIWYWNKKRKEAKEEADKSEIEAETITELLDGIQTKSTEGGAGTEKQVPITQETIMKELSKPTN